MAKRTDGRNARRRADQVARNWKQGLERLVGKRLGPQSVENYRQGMQEHFGRLWQQEDEPKGQS